MRTTVFLGLVLFAAVVAACSSSSTPTTPSQVNVTGGGAGGEVVSTQVYILGRDGGASFRPSPATVAGGSSLVWINSDTETHRIVADDGSFDTGALEPDAQSTPIVVATGAATYHCPLHAGETGTVVAK